MLIISYKIDAREMLNTIRILYKTIMNLYFDIQCRALY